MQLLSTDNIIMYVSSRFMGAKIQHFLQISMRFANLVSIPSAVTVVASIEEMAGLEG